MLQHVATRVAFARKSPFSSPFRSMLCMRLRESGPKWEWAQVGMGPSGNGSRVCRQRRKRNSLFHGTHGCECRLLFPLASRTKCSVEHTPDVHAQRRTCNTQHSLQPHRCNLPTRSTQNNAALRDCGQPRQRPRWWGARLAMRIVIMVLPIAYALR